VVLILVEKIGLNFADPSGEDGCINTVPAICAYTMGFNSNAEDYEICFI